MRKRLFLIIVFISLIILSSQKEIQASDLIVSELGFLEVLQTIILFFTFNSLLKNRKYFESIVRLFFLKLALIGLILYEELSFITNYLGLNFLNQFNYKSEFNLHNLNIWQDFEFKQIPLFGDISLNTLIYIFMTLLLGFGSYLKVFRKFNFLFLEKNYSFFMVALVLNLAISPILFELSIIERRYLVLDECVELFLYILIFMDNLEKINKAKKSLKIKS